MPSFASRKMWAAALLVLCVCVMVPLCSTLDVALPSPDLTSPQSEREPGPVTLEPGARIAYIAQFDWEDAYTKQGSYYFTNNLGYHFRIDMFHLATSTIQLRKCGEDKEGASLFESLFMSVAYANHFAHNDASMVYVAQAENGLKTQEILLGTGVTNGGSYCKVFAQSSQIKPLREPIQDNTLLLRGAYTSTPHTEATNWTPIDVRIAMAQGLIEELVIEREPRDMPEHEVSVVLTRYPTRAFDDNDPTKLLPVELAWEVISNLLHSSSAHVYEASRD